MPSRDDRTPSFCSERMKICQRHLSKVYSRSKNLLVTARTGSKVVPEVTGTAARGFADGGNNSGDGDGLSKFEKKKISPYLNAVAGLFDGPSLLKQFQLKKLRSGLADRNFKAHSQPDCPQSCNESTCKDPDSIPLFFKDNPVPASALASEIYSDIKSSAKTAAIRGNSTSTAENYSEADDYIEPTLSSSSLGNKSGSEGRVHSDVHQNLSASTLGTIMEERVRSKRTDTDRRLQVGKNSSSSFLPSNYKIDDVGKWSIPPYLSNVSSEQRTFSKLVVPQSSFPSYQQSNSKLSMYRIDDTSTSNRASLLPSTEVQQRAISTTSTRNPSHRLPITGPQQNAVFITTHRNPSQRLSGTHSLQQVVSNKSGRNPSQLMSGNDTHSRAVSTMVARNPPQFLPGAESPHTAVSTGRGKNRPQSLRGNDSLQRAGSTDSARNHFKPVLGSDSQQRAVSRMSGGNPHPLVSGTDSKQQVVSTKSGRNPPQGMADTESTHTAVSTMDVKNPYQLLLGPDSQQKAVSSTSGWDPPQRSQGTDTQQGAVSTSTFKGPFETSSASSQQRAALTTRRGTFSKMLPDNDSQQKAVSTLVDPEPGTFASRLNKKVSQSGNVLQASVANFFGSPAGSPKPLHTLTVSQIHDAICDHSAPDCPSFIGKEKSRASPEVPNPTLLRQSLEEHDPPHADALGSGAPTNAANSGDFDPSDQEIVSANEKCAQYAFEVRTDMKRQEKSSASLWKYGSMAVCTENPGRDYTTGESPPDAWDLMAKNKFEVSGMRWSKSGSRKVVNHVCEILKKHKWGKGAIDLLDAVKGTVNSYCVNAILQQQKDPHLCLAFFNWAKQQKGYKHDVFAFTTMINILGRARNLRGVRHLLEDMHTGGIEPTVATYNTLILCYGKVESLNESLRVFRIMQEAGCKPDNVTYSILIHLCIKAGYLHEALKLYQGMREAGVQPDTITYSIVIDSLGKSGNLREGRKLFREMRERGYVPNEFTYNSMINRHAKARKTQHALKYYTEMRAAGFKLNAVTCTTMMGVLGSLGKFEQAEGVFSEMQQAGIVADTAAYSLMINMWGNSGNLDKAVSWYGRMLGNLVTPSLSVFSSLVNAHLEANLYQAAQHFLTSMGMWGINSDLKLYTLLLRHCTVCEKQEHADAVLGIMDRLGHPAHRFLYELLTAKNQDRQAITSRVESYFDSLEQEDQESKQAFANALIEFLHKLQCKTDPGFVWEIAMNKGLYPSAILRREAPNHWLVDLHSMSVGTALVALPRLLVMLKDNWVQSPTKRVYIVTGWGKRSRVTGTSAVKQAVSDVLESTRSPFTLDNANAGVFVSYGPPFCDWMSQPLIMKKLGAMATEGIVK